MLLDADKREMNADKIFFYFNLRLSALICVLKDHSTPAALSQRFIKRYWGAV